MYLLLCNVFSPFYSSLLTFLVWCVIINCKKSYNLVFKSFIKAPSPNMKHKATSMLIPKNWKWYYVYICVTKFSYISMQTEYYIGKIQMYLFKHNKFQTIQISAIFSLRIIGFQWKIMSISIRNYYECSCCLLYSGHIFLNFSCPIA